MMDIKINKAYKGKTILISGGKGYIGSSLVKQFAKINCKIIILDRQPDISWLIKNVKAKILFVKGDVSKRKTWERVLSGVDFLFHLAALEYNRHNFDIIKDWQTNALSIAHFIEVCRQKNYHPKIIFSSSANLFGLADKLPVSEKIPSNPISLWSVHKLAAENYLRIYAQKYGIKSVILRLTNVYGPTENLKTTANVIINKAILQAINSHCLNLYSNQNCFRDYIFLKDVVRAFLYAGAGGNLLWDGSCYVIGSGEGMKIAKAFKLIAKEVKILTGKTIKIKLDNSASLEPFDKRNFIANSALFHKLTDWKPEISFNKGIKLTAKILFLQK